MKCINEECHICEEQIKSPDSKTLFKIIYEQFLGYERELKEEHEEICLIIKILLLKIIDDDKIHRISFLILKNTKVSLGTFLKINYMYDKLLDEMNQDLKNLLTIKYSEVYDDLLFIINYFEEIFGFVKSRTEKVELVINKTNEVGKTYQKIISNLFFLKRNKRIYFDTYNMLQIICLIRLIFQKNVDVELTENLEYNFQDFLENVDRIFEENLSFVVRYDFYDLNWRIKKVPKAFIDVTHIKVDDLIDQSLEKIFPNFLGKKIIKELEELILRDKFDGKLILKTFVLDCEANVKYVKFEINIIPNLYGNYLLFLNCYFQNKQVMIIDEQGNFINGCDDLYKKIGIKSEVISMSRGKINMFNVFNIEKNMKLEDIKIVSINIDNLLDIIKKVYLIDIDNLNTDTVPPFLYEIFNLNTNRQSYNMAAINNNLAVTASNINAGYSNNEVNNTNISKSSGNINGSVITINGVNVDQIKNTNVESTIINNNILSLNLNMKKFRENNLIYLNLFQLIVVNNKKYIVYSLKIKTDEQMKKENKFEDETPQGQKQQQYFHSKYLNKINNPKDTIISSPGDLKTPLVKPIRTDSDMKTSEINVNTNLANNAAIYNDAQKHLGEYYNYFYETNGSASMQIDHVKGFGNSTQSQGNTSSSDVFTFLLIKNVPKKSGRTNYFERFLYAIYIFNLCLVLLGLISIIYLNSYSKNTLSFIETFQIFYTLRTNIASATANILSMCKFTSDNFYSNLNIINNNSTTSYNNANSNSTNDVNKANTKYIETFNEFFAKENFATADSNSDDLIIYNKKFSYDALIKQYNSYYAEIILNNYKNFEKYTYNLYGAADFATNIDYFTPIIMFNSIGNPIITKNKISDTLDYLPIMINTIDKRSDEKIYINISYLNFEGEDYLSSNSKLANIDLNNISLSERNFFNQNFNLYKIFINFFSVYVKNFNTINDSFFEFGYKYTNKLQLETQILLILIVVLHVIFVLISLFSIFIYRKILLSEFNSLYSINEENITKLKEKFKYVEEIIKSEKYPSKIYIEIRKMRELENLQQRNNNNNTNSKNAKHSDEKAIRNGSHKNYFNVALTKHKSTNKIGINNSVNNSFSNINHNNSIIDGKISKNFSMNSNNNFPNNSNNNNNKVQVGGQFQQSSKINRKPTAISNDDSKDASLENYYSYNYSGATKGLLRSFSIKNRKKMEEIKKQHSKAQASMMLLSRLNFEFDFINNYTNFIVFMSVFYVVFGIIILIILEDKYKTLNQSLIFINTFVDRNINIFNYLIGVKLAVMLNRKWPNTIKPDNFGTYSNYSSNELYNIVDNYNIFEMYKYGFYSENSVIKKYFEATNTIFEMESQYSFLNDILSFESSFTKDNSCQIFQNYPNDVIINLKEKDPLIVDQLIQLCKSIPIMHSNIASIFTNVITDLREILSQFIDETVKTVSFKIEILQEKFRMIDTIYFIFIEPYFKYIRDTLIKTEINSVVVDYFNFLIIIFTLNIFIDFLMLLFIWFKNYKQVIKYVNNIQLVADSLVNL